MASTLDYSYIAQLVTRAKTRDSNAFAELYAATVQGQYRFAKDLLEDREQALWAVKATYVEAYDTLNKLQDASLVMAWLNQINFRICCGMTTVPEGEYPVSQVLMLPFTESQCVFLKHYRGLNSLQIAQLLDISLISALRYLSSGEKRLNKMKVS